VGDSRQVDQAVMGRRGSGVLLHITSLPSPYGVGDLGPEAYRFADFLAETKQSYWQVLPLNPTDPGSGNSPYSSNSAFGGNTLLISPDRLLEEGFLDPGEIPSMARFAEHRCEFEKAIPFKRKILDRAYQRFKAGQKERDAFEDFCRRNSSWLEDFVHFVVLKRRFRGRVWSEWPQEFRGRHPEALSRVSEEYPEDLEKEKFFQFLFFREWHLLKDYCNQRGIRLIGDLSIYVSLDSADVWSHPDLFKMDDEKKPLFVSGVPPDYFSKTGQLWGNPVYRWDVLKETGFEWWVRRMAHHLNLYDAVRIDHFRGLVAYWEVPADEETAINGKWVEVPTEDFFGTLSHHFNQPSIIAEDLGVITPDVKEVLSRFGYPGMKILLFAFDSDDPDHPYLPYNFSRNCLVYTGTHDNNTVRGWFEGEASADDQRRFFRYVGRKVTPEEVSWEMIRLAMSSVAHTAIFPLQDILGLDGEARMNRPSVAHGNWEWRFSLRQLTESIKQRLREMTTIYGRG